MNPFLAEIRIFSFNFAPRGWAFCAGQILPISPNSALFSLIGTTYGGNGSSTFALPDLRGSVPIGTGQGAGLSQRFLGESSGGSSVSLITSEMPAHSHNLQADTKVGDTNSFSPSGAMPGNSGALLVYSGSSTGSFVNMSPFMLALAGGNSPHNNMMPYLVLNYCIALQGVYPMGPQG